MSNFQQYGSLIAPHDTWTLVSLVVLGVAGAIYLEQTYRWAAKLSGPVLALVGAKSLAIAVTIAAVACKLSALINPDSTEPASFARSFLGNRFVLITLISVLAATLLHRNLDRINGSEEIGAYMLYMFFFLIGLPADLMAVLLNVPLMFAFCLVIALVNLAVTLSLGKLMGLNLEELLICVNATLGGAPSAAAMAIAKGWPKLVLPALLVGIWGYVIGTPLGIAVGRILAGIF